MDKQGFNSAILLTVANLNHYLQNQPRDFAHGPVPQITCSDGTCLSVQAGVINYCHPRHEQGPWTHVKVMGCTSGVEPKNFSVDENHIGAYIPIEQVAKEILERGNALLT